jgi:MFS family permease
MVLSVYTVAALFARLFSGYLVDTRSRKHLLILSLALYVSIFGGYMLVATVATFIVLRFLHGLTWGLTSVSSNTVAIDVIPPVKRGQGIGYYGFCANLAMALAPWVATEIYDAWGYYVLIGCCLICGFASFVVALFIKTKPRPKVAEERVISLDRFILVKALPIGLNLMLCAVSYGMIVSYGVLYGKAIDIQNTGLLCLFMAAGIGTSRVIAGRFVDNGHIHTVALLSQCLLTVALVVFSLVHNVVAFCGMALLCGIAFGSMVPAFQTLFVNMAHHNQRGTANSTYLTSFDVGIGTGMLLGGFVASFSSLATAYLVSGMLSLVSIPYYYFVSQRVYAKGKV